MLIMISLEGLVLLLQAKEITMTAKTPVPTTSGPDIIIVSHHRLYGCY